MEGQKMLGDESQSTSGIEYLAPFLPVLAQYKFGFLTVSTLALIVLATIFLFRNNLRVRIDKRYKYYILFILFAVSRDLLRMLFGVDPRQAQINRVLEYTMNCALVILVTPTHFEEDRLYKTWRIAGFIYTAGLLYHFFCIYFLGSSISPISIIPGYAIRDSGTQISRPTSFFAEPASFADALIPLIFLSLRKNDLRTAGLFTFAVLLSTSSVGVVLAVVLWGLYIFKKNVKIYIKVLAVMLSCVIIFAFFNARIFESSFQKILGVTGGGGTFHSRIGSSIDVIKTLKPSSLIFGTNYSDVNHYISDHSELFSSSSDAIIYWHADTVFLNTVARVVFQYGLLGLFFFFLPFYIVVRKREYGAKAYAIAVIIACFVQSMLLNPYYFSIMLFLGLYESEEKGNEMFSEMLCIDIIKTNC